MKTTCTLYSTATIVLLVLALTGCAGPAAEPVAEAPAAPAAEAPPAQIKLGLSLPGYNWYLGAVESGAQSAADDSGVELVIYEAGFDPSVQRGQIQTIVSSTVDALLVFPSDDYAVAVYAEDAANSAGIPWFALLTLPEGVSAQSVIKGDFPQDPLVLGYTSVETAWRHLKGDSVGDVVDLPSLELPDEVQGTIVPPPSDRSGYENQLSAAMVGSGIDPDDYHTEAVVIFPAETGALGLAAPIATGFPTTNTFPYETPIMAFYDSQGENENGAIAYEVSFTENGVATLYSPAFDVTITREAFFADQTEVLGSTWALFVEGSCWLCGCCDGRCGCLICWP